jgi:hypothetical protein
VRSTLSPPLARIACLVKHGTSSFREELVANLIPRAAPIETSDTGIARGPGVFRRRTITGWRQIGTMTFDAT